MPPAKYVTKIILDVSRIQEKYPDKCGNNEKKWKSYTMHYRVYMSISYQTMR